METPRRRSLVGWSVVCMIASAVAWQARAFWLPTEEKKPLPAPTQQVAPARPGPETPAPPPVPASAPKVEQIPAVKPTTAKQTNSTFEIRRKKKTKKR